jgi:hypothetical protein
MPYVVYHKATTRFLRILRNGYWEDAKFATEGAAKAALTRLEKKGAIERESLAIAESSVFHTTIEKTETVYNLMSGKPVIQSVNTPLCCDPSSETYWSM